ncbi:MAG: hypothetical protein Q8O89_01715 [Nanoarchaeota archaeon]|nr:hypothetical protein [Nanoarchaeota archaeon]
MKKIPLVGILCLTIGGLSACEYQPNKKSEHYYRTFSHPYICREILIWPENHFKEPKEIKLESVEGKIKQLEGLEGYTSTTSPNGGRYYYTLKRDSIVFITLDNRRKFVYVGDFFGGKNDEVKLAVLPVSKLELPVSKLEEGSNFFEESRLVECENTKKAFEQVPLTKLQHLDGIIEDYEIVKDF